MASINSVLTYNANLSPAQAQLKALTGQVGALTAAFNTLDKSAVRAQGALASTFLANVGQIGGFTTQMVQSGTAVDNFGKALAKQRLTMRQYFREAIAGYTKQNSMMKQLAAQQVRMQQSMMVPMGAGTGGAGRAAVLTPTSIGAMGTAAAMASQKFSIFNELVRGGSERLLNFGKNTQWTGRQLMVGFTLPLILFTGLVSKQFREIDKELTRFEKVYGADLVTTVEDSTAKMREQVKQLAYEISSSYGIAAKETAALAADIAQTGKEGEDLIASVKQTTRLAVLGEVERQEAMRATLSIQNAFKLNTDELSESIDFLNAVENQTSTNLQDLAGAIPRVGPVIQALGGDIKDMSLLLVAMREGGVSAGEAANALKSGLGRLINPTQRARDVAASFGISLEDIIQNSKGQLLPMIFGLQDALQGLDDFGRAQVLEKVFGKYQFARMAALFANLRRQGSQTLSVMELAGASTAELAGIANKELKALQESSAMRFQRTIENLKNSLLPLGQVFTESLIPILSAIGSGVKSFIEFFQALPGPVKNFSKYVLIITALAGPIVMLVGLFGNLIANGIKFSMMIVRMGAKIAGLRFEKFELLTADVIAAKAGVDNLNNSFITQEAALKRLISVMGTYSTALAGLMRTNPSLFTAGAAGAATRTLPVLRRQKGSTSPERVPGGYGGGDKVPALLEPGEFVVRKEAARGNVDFLRAMNRGQVKGYEFGDVVEARSPGRLSSGKIKHNAPDTILKALVHDAQRQRMAEVVEHIARRAGIEFDNDDQRRQATKTHLAHYEKDMRAGLKYFDPANLLLASGAENQAMEQLSRGNAGRYIISEIRRLGDSQPSLLKIHPQTGEIEIRQPRTPSQMRMMSNIVGSMIDQPDNRKIWGTSGSDVRQRVWGPLFKAIMDERMNGGGRLLPRELPLATNVAQAIRRAGGDIPAAARRSIALTESQVMGTTPMTPARGAAGRPGIVGPGAVPPSMQRPSGPGPRPFVMTPRGAMLRVMPGEVMLPKPMYADYGAVVTPRGAAMPLKLPTAAETAAFNDRMLKSGLISAPTNARGPQESLSSSRQAAQQQPQMMKGMGLMNIAFASSMLVGSMSMAGGASNDLAMKLGILSGAVMGAAAMMQMFSGKKVMGNFLGLGSLGKKVSARGAASIPAPFAPTAAGATAARASGAAGAGKMGLLRAGGALSALGGPLGIGIAAALAAGVGGFMMYQKAAEQARERAVAAFRDPAKTAEYFAEEITSGAKAIESINLENISEDLGTIDENLRAAVAEDYQPLIDRLKYSSAESGARQLGLAFNNMLAAGLSAEKAKAAIEAIAAEAGATGAAAFEQGIGQNLFKEKTNEEIVDSIVDAYDPNKNAELKSGLESAIKSQGRVLQEELTSFENIVSVASPMMGLFTGKGFGGLSLGAVAPDWMDFMLTDEQEAFRDMYRAYDQLKNDLQEITAISGDAYLSVMKSLAPLYKEAPEYVIQRLQDLQKGLSDTIALTGEIPEGWGGYDALGEFIGELVPEFKIFSGLLTDQSDIALLGQMAVAGLGSEFQNLFKVAEDGSLILDTKLANSLLDTKVKMDQLAAAAKDLAEELKTATEEEIDIEIEESEKNLDKYRKKLERLDEKLEKADRRGQKQVNIENRASEKTIQGLESQIDLIEERAEARREEFDETMKALQKEKEEISESTDAYIDSIQERQKADSFYANQRKTAFSALEKLAAGDVFGFLQEREQMSQDAQQFAYDEQIKGIEKARDRELDSIDRTMEAEREKQEEYEKNTEERIDLINSQIDAERDLMEERQKNHDRDMRILKRKQRAEKIALEGKINAETTALADLRAMKDTNANDEINSAASVTQRLGQEYGKRYEQQVSQMIKLQFQQEVLNKQQEGLSYELARNAAAQSVLPSYLALTESTIGNRGRGGTSLVQEFLNWVEGVTLPPGQGTNIQDPSNIPGSGSSAGETGGAGPPGQTTSGNYYRQHSGGNAGTSNSEWYHNYEGLRVIGPDGKKYVWDSSQTRPRYVLEQQRKLGGYIQGPGTQTSDSIPARLSNGEYVVRASSVSKYGKGMMDAINEARFAEGGFVGRATPKFLSGMQLPTVTPPAGDRPSGNTSGYTTGGASGTPLFDENVLKNLGHSLTTAQAVLGFLNSGGWPKDLHRLAWTIAMRESGGNPRLYHDHINNPGMYSPGNGDYGLFQINKKAYGSQSWFDEQKLLDGNYNSSMAFKYVSNSGSTFRPWALLKTYNGTSAGFDWSMYGTRPWWGASTEKNTNALWPAFLGYRGGTTTYSGGSSGAQNAVNYIRSQIGKPYVNTPPGASPPNSWDCSKLTAWAWAVATGADPSRGYNDPNAKVKLTPLSHEQGNQITKRVISKGYGQPISGLIPGDILYFAQNGPGVYPGHTSMYVGNDQVVQASSPSTGVILSPLNSSWNTGPGKFMWGGPPKGYKSGGFVTGPGGPIADRIPAMLSNGEYVVRASSVDKYGKGMLDQINAGQFGIGKFANGGAVGMYGGGGLVSPSYTIPMVDSGVSSNNLVSSNNTNMSTNNSTNVKIIVNARNSASAKAIASRVANMINSSNNRRNHSRSLG